MEKYLKYTGKFVSDYYIDNNIFTEKRLARKCIISSQAEIWWNKDDDSYSNPQIARTINQAIHRLLLSNSADPNPGYIISLSYLLEPKVCFRLVVEPNLSQISDDFSDIFLFDDQHSETLRSRLEKEKNYKIEPIFDRLWRLKRRSLGLTEGSNGFICCHLVSVSTN